MNKYENIWKHNTQYKLVQTANQEAAFCNFVWSHLPSQPLQQGRKTWRNDKKCTKQPGEPRLRLGTPGVHDTALGSQCGLTNAGNVREKIQSSTPYIPHGKFSKCLTPELLTWHSGRSTMSTMFTEILCAVCMSLIVLCSSESGHPIQCPHVQLACVAKWKRKQW